MREIDFRYIEPTDSTVVDNAVSHRPAVNIFTKHLSNVLATAVGLNPQWQGLDSIKNLSFLDLTNVIEGESR